MATASPEVAADDVLRESRISRATDSRCLSHMIPWIRRSTALIGIDLYLAYLATTAGAGVWAACWFAARGAHRLHIVWLARQLDTGNADKARESLNRLSASFWVGGSVNALLIPIFFWGSVDVSVKLIVTLLTVWLSGPMVVGSAGIVRAFAGGSLPAFALILCWILDGGRLGLGLALLCALSLATAFAAVRQQRHGWEDLVRLLDSNDVLAASLKAQRDLAQSASESKTRFFAAASHDLRQPMHALSINSTTLDLLARRSGDPVLQEVSQGVASALRQSRSLLDGLLDISRLDAHAVHAQAVPTHLKTTLEALRAEFGALAQQSGLTFTVDLGPSESDLWALTDPDQLMRILGNLVDNAIKFTRSGGVTLSARRTTPQHIVVCVIDSGPGIAEADRERVFEEFYQVGNPSRDRSHGLGLGLAIVKRTASLLSIDVDLISPPEGGATFALTLRAVEPLEAAAAAPMQPVGSRRLAVLLIDDEVDVRTSLCTYLRQIDWPVETAASGSAAIALLERGFSADVMVVDFRLKDETAADVIAAMRAKEIWLPAVVVTGDTASEHLSEFAASAKRVLHKPVDGEQLVRALLEAVDS